MFTSLFFPPAGKKDPNENFLQTTIKGENNRKPRNSRDIWTLELLLQKLMN